jgi:hypothetical protein
VMVVSNSSLVEVLKAKFADGVVRSGADMLQDYMAGGFHSLWVVLDMAAVYRGHLVLVLDIETVCARIVEGCMSRVLVK